MAIGMADLHKAINTAWDASTLDATFKALWSDPTDTEFFVLNDQEAPGEQPFPYVVMDQTMSSTSNRMSGGITSLREIRNIEIRFNIHTRDIDSDGRTAKTIASVLAEEIMKVFGGHPTVTPTGAITLDNGKHLITTYTNGFSIRTEEDQCQWVLVYVFKIDVPVAV